MLLFESSTTNSFTLTAFSFLPPVNYGMDWIGEGGVARNFTGGWSWTSVSGTHGGDEGGSGWVKILKIVLKKVSPYFFGKISKTYFFFFF